MIHHLHCPSCEAETISEKFIAKDYSVTGEQFPVMACRNCHLLFTQDIPDEKEIQRYYQSEQYISHSDTSRGLINGLYHRVRKRTLKGKRRLITKKTGLRSGNLLDTGIGTGAFLDEMRKEGWTIAGIEPDATARKNARKLHGIESVEPYRSVEFGDASFDVITLWHVLEHVHQLQHQMAELKRLLKDEGAIFIAVPNHRAYDAAFYKRFWAAWDVPRHLYHFSYDSMKYLCRQHGFRIDDIRPMWFDSFYVSMLSDKYKSGRTNFLRAGFVGLVSNIKAAFSTKYCSSIIYVLKKEDAL